MTQKSSNPKLKARVFKIRLLGSTWILISVGITWYVVALNGRQETPSSLDNILFVALSGTFQILGAYSFSQNGKASRDLARTAVEQLVSLIRQIKAARLVAETTLLSSSKSQDRMVVGILSVELSSIEEQTTNARKIWTEFHPDAQNKFEEIDQ